MLRLPSWLRAKINSAIKPQAESRQRGRQRKKPDNIWTYLEKRGRSASEIEDLKRRAREAERLNAEKVAAEG